VGEQPAPSRTVITQIAASADYARLTVSVKGPALRRYAMMEAPTTRHYRVRSMSYDQFTRVPSLDRIVMRR
jgi:hypothetical protein